MKLLLFVSIAVMCSGALGAGRQRRFISPYQNQWDYKPGPIVIPDRPYYPPAPIVIPDQRSYPRPIVIPDRRGYPGPIVVPGRSCRSYSPVVVPDWFPYPTVRPDPYTTRRPGPHPTPSTPEPWH